MEDRELFRSRSGKLWNWDKHLARKRGVNLRSSAVTIKSCWLGPGMWFRQWGPGRIKSEVKERGVMTEIKSTVVEPSGSQLTRKRGLGGDDTLGGSHGRKG